MREALQNEAEQRVLAMQTEMEAVLTETNTHYEKSQRALAEAQDAYHTLQNENKALSLKLQQTLEAYHADQKTLAAAQAQVEQLAAYYQQVRDDLNQAITQGKQDLQAQAQQHQQEIEALREAHEKQCHQFLTDLDAFKTSKLKTENHYHLLQQDYKALQKEQTNLQQQCQQYEMTLKQATAQQQQCDLQLQAQRHTILLLEKDLSYAEEKNAEWKSLYENAQAILLKQQEKLGQLEQQLRQFQIKKKKQK